MTELLKTAYFRNKPVIICVPSKPIDKYGHRSLNLIEDEDGHLYAVKDEELTTLPVEIEE